jgi:hypothetical protein
MLGRLVGDKELRAVDRQLRNDMAVRTRDEGDLGRAEGAFVELDRLRPRCERTGSAR